MSASHQTEGGEGEGGDDGDCQERFPFVSTRYKS